MRAPVLYEEATDQPEQLDCLPGCVDGGGTEGEAGGGVRADVVDVAER